MLAALSPATCVQAGVTEFCLDGEFNLGARYQGIEPSEDEFVPTRWCVITEDESQRALFRASGKSNPDMHGSWAIAVLPPDVVRIVNADDPPDIEFRGADALTEALRIRRIDPRRFVEEHAASPIPETRVQIEDGKLLTAHMSTDLPLRGRVPVKWRWDWSYAAQPELRVEVDGDVFFRATGSWRTLHQDDAEKLWAATPGADPVQVPGEHWPSRIDMRRVEIADSVHLVRGVRSGFQHLVVETDQGLVVADAPAGWVEIHQLPPSDLVPGLGISGLSEKLIDFLQSEFPGQPLRAVALTHAHDDHAGGARAFAAAGGKVYAPAKYEAFLETAFNRDTMPRDRFSDISEDLDVLPVSDTVTLADESNAVRLLSMGAGPHSSAGLGVHAVDAGFFYVSDVHVPNSEDDVPRTNRVVTECWFAGWATQNLPPETIVLNSHSTPQTPVSRLARYLESEACQRLRE